MMNHEPHDDHSELVKEVYARFGLAVYFAQVLEHGIVNALVILDLVPSRRHLALCAVDWEREVDGFMNRHFQATMGRMMKNLRDTTKVDDDLEHFLSEALRKRNWLVHDFFRERAHELMSSHGKKQMIAEIDACRDLFQSADVRLGEIVAPLRRKAGLTDELLAMEYERLMHEARE
jgi:hypothetical protein